MVSDSNELAKKIFEKKKTWDESPDKSEPGLNY